MTYKPPTYAPNLTEEEHNVATSALEIVTQKLDAEELIDWEEIAEMIVSVRCRNYFRKLLGTHLATREDTQLPEGF